MGILNFESEEGKSYEGTESYPVTGTRAHLGLVPLPRMVGYGASVWDLLPTYPPRITEQCALGGVLPTPPELRNMVPGISGITPGIR
jgi:hypothetical protein